MNAFTTPILDEQNFCTAPRAATLENYIRAHEFERPTLVISRADVVAQYRALEAGLGEARIHYAVKANPEKAILEALRDCGSAFDCASRKEIEDVLSLGVPAADVSFGNTIKRAKDIEFAWKAGVKIFAADAVSELEKIAQNAPGAQVYIRLLVGSTEADWPLSRKFGCSHDMALELLGAARDLGLEPIGFSFHVGSQTRQAQFWEKPLAQLSETWQAAKDAGFDLTLINIGGGFPAFYGDEIQGPTEYAQDVMRLVRKAFPGAQKIMAEPGRSMVAEAGMIAAEVLLVSRKSHDDMHRWVYLDIGKFSGLAETMDEAIRYQFITDRDHEDTAPCILAGPSCDSADVLYINRPIALPVGLTAGDRVMIRSCGAYTTTYASVGFNGFPPLDVIVI